MYVYIYIYIYMYVGAPVSRELEGLAPGRISLYASMCVYIPM